MGVTPDLAIVIVFDVANDHVHMYSNVKDEALEEVLSSFVRDMSEVGAANLKPIERRDIYTIKLGLLLKDDTFYYESDCGSSRLVVGLVAATLGKLPLVNHPLSELKA